MENEINPIELGEVLGDELHQIRGADQPTGSPELESVFAELHKARMSALCFSGGGIRSATFGLGIMQSLAKHGLLNDFDYLSTVSGGGYLGSWLSAWIQRAKNDFVERTVINDADRYNDYKNFKSGRPSGLSKLDVDEIDNLVMDYVSSHVDLPGQGILEVQTKLSTSSIAGQRSPDPEPTELQHLREYSNYLTPKAGLLSADTWTFFGIYFRNLFLNWTIFIPLISALLITPRLLLAITNIGPVGDAATIGLLGAGLVLASFALAFVINKLPSRNRLDSDLKYDSDTWVLVLGIAPLIALAFIVTTLVAWYSSQESSIAGRFKFLPPVIESDTIYFVIFAVATCGLGFLLFFIWRLMIDGIPKRVGRKSSLCWHRA